MKFIKEADEHYPLGAIEDIDIISRRAKKARMDNREDWDLASKGTQFEGVAKALFPSNYDRDLLH